MTPFALVEPQEAAAARADDQYVTFYLNQEAFAFPMADVIEIVRVPDTIDVPMTPPALIGLANLRGNVLTILDLRRLLNLPEAGQQESMRVIVCDVGRPVGLIVDKVARVLHVDAKHIDANALMNASMDAGLITGVAKNIDEHDLIQLVDVRAVVEHSFSTQFAAERAATAATGVSDPSAARDQEIEEKGMQETTPQSTELGNEDATQMVVFILAGQEFAVGIEAVQEITRLSEQMTQVPKTPDFIEGMVNLRGSVLPVLNMRTRFGLPRMERNDGQRILVLDLQGTRVGFITDAVVEVLRLSGVVIEQAPHLSDEQSRIMGQVINLRDRNRLIQVLDVNQLLSERERCVINQAAA